ncbi:MAG: nuclear transport factor 2 family protein [Cyclobacteriaceae bacterium]|nr:nuclear transport factor 2 family protein [Cyclobacteriaceae bacterium]
MLYRKVFFLIGLLSLGHLSFSQQEKQAEELRLILQSYSKAVEKYDTATIEKLFDDRMVVTSANGNLRNKQQEINDLLYKPANSTLIYFLAENLNIIVDGQTGIVKGVLRWQFKDQPVTSRTFTFTLVKKGEHWKIIAQHIGRTP